MSFFRSAPMSLCHLIVHEESAFDYLMELGYVGKVQFVNVVDNSNQGPNNKFTSKIKRCDELLRAMKYLQEEIKRADMQTVYYPEADKERPKENDLLEIEMTVQSLYTELTDVQRHWDALERQRFTFFEHIQILECMEHFLTGLKINEVQVTSTDSTTENLMKDFVNEELNYNGSNTGALVIMCGSIPLAHFAVFELMVWRLSHGNAFIQHATFELPAELVGRFKYQFKYAFMLAFVGEKLQQKLLKICQCFEIELYACGNTSTQRRRLLHELLIELVYLKQVCKKTSEHKRHLLAVAAGGLFRWRGKIQKMLQVYHLLNRFGIVHEMRRQYFKYLRTDCWVPRADVHKVRLILARNTESEASSFPPLFIERQYHLVGCKQPTHFETNKFTRCFQNMIDSYGIATYRELNPAPYTIVTFPFLFAVMFGDVGHGILMCLFAFVLIWREKIYELRLKESHDLNEIFDLLFAGRYIMLLMGLFSIYTGLIYNEVFSKSVNMFGSMWRANFTNETLLQHKLFALDPANRTHYVGRPYIFGIDPVWKAMTANANTFNNSLKMKIAIILGVLQMFFGLCLSGCNAFIFRNNLNFFLVFLPQLIFLLSTFFYLVVLIFYKWSHYGGHAEGVYSAGCAPSILHTFMNIFLRKAAKAPAEGCSPIMYAGQSILERTLLALAVVSVLILFGGKPLCIINESRRLQHIFDPDEYDETWRSTLSSFGRSFFYTIGLPETRSQAPSIQTEENLSEVWLHQGFLTIECVLGSVSHIASYLRLWALSHAHAQLSKLLWNFVLSPGLTKERGFYNAIVIFFTFAGFAVLTVIVLVVMEGFSAFLHALRLHWFEFQSKFYGGLGDAFAPFYFPASRKKDSLT